MQFAIKETLKNKTCTKIITQSDIALKENYKTGELKRCIKILKWKNSIVSCLIDKKSCRKYQSFKFLNLKINKLTQKLYQSVKSVKRTK